MKIKNIAIVSSIALTIHFSCSAQEVFLHNSYGAPIYYKNSPDDTELKKINNNIRIPLGPLSSIDTMNIEITAGSTLSSVHSLKPTFTALSFAASQHPHQDAILYINPSSFYQAWNIEPQWEKVSTISSFSTKEILNQTAQKELIKTLVFIKKPRYKQGTGKNQYLAAPIDRSNNQAINRAIDMVRTEKYDAVLLDEIYSIINTQVPFQPTYSDEVNLKQDTLNFIRQEINRLK